MHQSWYISHVKIRDALTSRNYLKEVREPPTKSAKTTRWHYFGPSLVRKGVLEVSYNRRLSDRHNCRGNLRFEEGGIDRLSTLDWEIDFHLSKKINMHKVDYVTIHNCYISLKFFFYILVINFQFSRIWSLRIMQLKMDKCHDNHPTTAHILTCMFDIKVNLLSHTYVGPL